MTFKSFLAILRKEFRQQYLLWISLVISCIGLQMIVLITDMLNERQNIKGPEYFGIAFVILLIYLVASISIIFCNEHEERTYGFIRVLPITRGSIVFGKIAWVLGSTILLALTVLLMAFLFFQSSSTSFASMTENSNRIVVISTYLLIMIIGFCWGLFWTVRLKNQMLSFLLAGICAVLQIMFASLISSLVYSPSIPNSVFHSTWITLNLLASIPVGVIGLIGAWGWIAKRENASSYQAIAPQTQVEKLRELAIPPRGEFRWLLWQTFRQSRPMLLFALGFGIVTFLVCSVILLSSGNPEDLFRRPPAIVTGVLMLGYAGWCMLLALVPFAFCGSIFWKDQQREAYQVLCNRGIAPGKIWWSRILVFGTTYFWAPLTLLMITVLYGIWLGFVHIGDVHPWSDQIRELISEPNVTIAAKVYLVLFFAIFCIGQYISILSRSFVIPIFGTFFFAFVLTAWSALMVAELNLSLLWTVYPILIACLISSRWRVADWLRGRNHWRAHLKAFSPLLIVMLAILTFIPLVRVFSVRPRPNTFNNPTYGLSIGSWSNRGWNFENVDENIAELFETIAENPHSIEKIQSAWRETQGLLKDPNKATHFYNVSKLEQWVYYNIREQMDSEDVSKDDLQAAIAFLEQIPHQRAPLLEVLARFQTAVAMDLKNGVFCDVSSTRAEIPHWRFKKPQENEVPLIYPVAFPWEKYRAKRLLDGDFQLFTEISEHREKSVMSDYWTSGLFDPGYSSMDINPANLPPTVSYYEKTYDFSFCSASLEAIHSFPYAEHERRVLLLETALRLYWFEHETLPGTLQELQETGILKEIPNTVSYSTGRPQPFGYVPFPEEMVKKESLEMDVVALFSDWEFGKNNTHVLDASMSNMMSGGGMGGMSMGTMPGFLKPLEIPRSKTPFLYEDINGLKFHPLTFAAPKE